MWMDVVDLRDFYNGSLGQVSRRLLRKRLRALWPDTRGMRILGVGFATPFLGPFLDSSERVIAAMPGAQGVMRWPAEGPNRVMLADETELPLPDRSIDRLIIVHGLEHTEHMRAMMRECWRVLTDGGRMIIVAPNRRGIWRAWSARPSVPAALILKASSTSFYVTPCSRPWRWGRPFICRRTLEGGAGLGAAHGGLIGPLAVAGCLRRCLGGGGRQADIRGPKQKSRGAPPNLCRGPQSLPPGATERSAPGWCAA